MFLWRFFLGKICQCPPALKVWKNSGPWLSMSKANTPCRFCFEVLVKHVPIFLHAPSQASKNLKKSISSCHPEALGDPKNGWLISLFYVPFKVWEKLIYPCIETIIDPLLPREQTGFRRGRSTVDQVTLLKQEIEDSFLTKKKAGTVFVDITAAYDTVWHHSLTCKLFRLLPDRHMVSLFMKFVCNRGFTLTTGTGKQSRLQRLKNGVPQGSVLATLLFNIYIYDLPVTVGRKFAYADELTL